MDMPPATSLRLPYTKDPNGPKSYVIIDRGVYLGSNGDGLYGTIYHDGGRTELFNIADYH